MDGLWVMSPVGIGLELIGAGYIVHAAWQARREMLGRKVHLDAIEHSVEALLAAVRSQFRKELVGFGLLGVGLLLQFIGSIVHE